MSVIRYLSDTDELSYTCTQTLTLRYAHPRFGCHPRGAVVFGSKVRGGERERKVRVNEEERAGDLGYLFRKRWCPGVKRGLLKLDWHARLSVYCIGSRICEEN